MIYLNGQVKVGRNESVVGAHTKGHNSNSIGVCYIGGVDSEMKPKDTMRPIQDLAMVNLLKSLKEKYPKAKIYGHNEFANKACPSFDVQEKYGWLNELD